MGKNNYCRVVLDTFLIITQVSVPLKVLDYTWSHHALVAVRNVKNRNRMPFMHAENTKSTVARVHARSREFDKPQLGEEDLGAAT